MSNLGRRPVEQRKEGLHLTSAERWAHNLPLTVMSLACTVISLAQGAIIENDPRECIPWAEPIPSPLNSLIKWILSVVLG
jgi:hypothetical protein